MKRLLVILLLFVPALAWAREVPVRDFFRTAEFTTVKLSPDGQHIAVTIPKPDRNTLAVMKVSDKSIVGSWDYGENEYFGDVVWVNNERLLFTTSHKTGRLDFAVGRTDMYASNIDGTHQMTIPNGNYYRVVSDLPADHDSVLITRSVEKAYLFKLNAYSGRLITISSSPLDMGTFLVDHAGHLRYSFGAMNDGSEVAYRRVNDKWELTHTTEKDGDVFLPVGFSPDDRMAYVFKGENGKPEALWLIDPENGTGKIVSNNGTVDADDLLWSSDRKTLLAVRYGDGIPYWDFVSPEHPEAKVFAGLIKAFPGKVVQFGGISADGNRILLRVYSDRDPGQVFLYDRASGQARFLLSSMEWIDPAEMSPTTPVQVRTRDGLVIHGYLTVPAGSDGKNLPLIINPHGGPHGVRDEWGFNPEVQLFANRGYAVLQMNYRGSGGYGMGLQTAGYRKWGTSMQDDLTDSVRWAIGEGIADPSRVCIYGASYGGYAALMSAEREPELYKCTVGYVGVYDLDVQMHRSDTAESDYGRSYLNTVYPTSASERQAQSPVYGADRIRAAVMLVAGAKDERVPIRNLHLMVESLEAAGRKPEQVIIEKKEAHGFRDVDNNVNLYTVMLQFFGLHLGGQQAAAAGAH